MSFDLTERARLKSQETAKEPQLVMEIEGVPTIYGSTQILESIEIGDPGLIIGGGWKIGGLKEIADQHALLGFDQNSGTTTKITQMIDPEKGRGSSVPSLVIGLVDKDEVITNLIAPGNVVDDVMGRRVRLYLGFNGTAYKKDFIPVFKGIIEDVTSNAGVVRFTIASPEAKKKGETFVKTQAKLDGGLDDSTTTIMVDTTTNFLLQGTRPNGDPETDLNTYIRIDDEIIQYTGLTSTTFTGCVRGSLGTTAVSHDDQGTVDSFYTLTGNAINLALKLMLSGFDGYFIEDEPLNNFVYISPTVSVPDAIFFREIDIEEKYGLTIDDWFTTAGASDGANNVSMKQITDIVKTDEGSYLISAGAGFVTETDSAATISFRSQYDSLGIGAGLGMIPDEVDVAQHQYLNDTFFSSYELDIYIDDTIQGKQWIEDEIYTPAAMFSLPRKARVSVNNTSAPIPALGTVTLDDTNVTNASKLGIKRSIGKNFFNSVIYKFDQEPLNQKFLSSIVTVAADSFTRIPVGSRALTIESRGLRTLLSAQNLVTSASDRRLKRYKFAAEFIENMEVIYGIGFNIECGDIVILDGSNLKISDSTRGDRKFEPRFMQVVNKSLDVKTGKVVLSIIDTAFDIQNRYGLISPASPVLKGISQTEFVITPWPRYSPFGLDEAAKWRRFKNPAVIVRSADYSIVASSVIDRVHGQQIRLFTPLGFTPSPDMIMELDEYDNQTMQMKLLYVFMSDDSNPFADGRSAYLML